MFRLPALISFYPALLSDLQDRDLRVGVEVLPSDGRRVTVQPFQQLPAPDAAPGNHVPALSSSTSHRTAHQCKLLLCLPVYLVAVFLSAVNTPP